MKYRLIYVFLILFIFLSEKSFAQDFESQLKNADVIEYFNKDRKMLYDIHKEVYIPLDGDIDLLIKRIAKEDIASEIKTQIYDALHEHFVALANIPTRHLKEETEREILSWVYPLMMELTKEEDDLSDRLIGMLPDAYPTMKLIFDPEDMIGVNKAMAFQYPKTLFHIVRMHPDPTLDYKHELTLAAKYAPYEAKQYLHYSNKVHSALADVEDDTIKLILDIYNKYKFAGTGYYFLAEIVSGKMSIEDAENKAQKEELLLNTLINLNKEPGYIAKQSIQEKINDLNSKLLMKLRWQRFSAKSQLELADLKQLSKENAFYLLVNSSNLLKKKDLENFCYLIDQLDPVKLSEQQLSSIDNDDLVELRNRFAEDEILDKLNDLLAHDGLNYLTDLELKKNSEPIENMIAESVIATPKNKVEVVRPKYVIKPYIFSISDAEKEKANFKFNQLKTLNNFEALKQSAYAEEILTYLANIDPIAVAAKFDQFNYEPYASRIVSHIATNAPQSVKGFLLKPEHKFNYFLDQSKDTTITTLRQINKKLGSSTRSYILLDQIIKGETNLFVADHAAKNSSLLIPQLIQILSQSNIIGKYSLEQELSYHALDFIRNFNISENTDGSFESNLYDLDAPTIYSFLVYSESEIIGVTFYKMYQELINKLQGRSLYSLMEDLGFNKARTFLRMAVYYGKEFDVYSHLNHGEKEALLSAVSEGLEQGDLVDVEEVINMAEIVINLKDYKAIQIIQAQFKKSYEQCELQKIDKGVAAYGILSSLLANRITSDEWAKYVAPFYRLPYINGIPGFELFNQNSANIQQYFFYNDRDGRNSYEKTPSDWRIEDKGPFVRIISRNGKHVEIFANKPELDDLGILKMESFLNKQEMHPQIVVHRGLSTHTLKTFNRIPSSAKIILDGSCGGFHVQQVALERAPGAHILCNRNIGTMQINDPMFKQISDDIRMGRDINWPDFWSKMTARLGSNPYFKDYIPPHKNVAALILKAYYDKLGIYK